MKTKKIGKIIISITSAKKKINLIKNKLKKNPKYLL